MAKLNKTQKKLRDQEAEFSKTVTDQKEIERLFPKHWLNMYRLMERPDIWGIVKPLVLDNKYSLRVNNGDFEPLLRNSALTDSDLVETSTAENEPLKVLKHPSCGDATLTLVAKIWHTGEGTSLDCITNFATENQIAKMYELFPPCKEDNKTLRYGTYASFTGEFLKNSNFGC